MGAQTVCSRMGRAIRSWLSKTRLQEELVSIDRAARADLGLYSVADIAALARNAGHRASRLQSMLRRLNLIGHPWLADAAYGRDLERTCALCPAARRCARWLLSPDRDGYRAFCPNAAEFSAMISDRRPAHWFGR